MCVSSAPFLRFHPWHLHFKGSGCNWWAIWRSWWAVDCQRRAIRWPKVHMCPQRVWDWGWKKHSIVANVIGCNVHLPVRCDWCPQWFIGFANTPKVWRRPYCTRWTNILAQYNAASYVCVMCDHSRVLKWIKIAAQIVLQTGNIGTQSISTIDQLFLLPWTPPCISINERRSILLWGGKLPSQSFPPITLNPLTKSNRSQ